MSQAVKESQRNTGNKRVEVITSLLLLAFSTVVIYVASEMKVFVRRAPGPGMFPLGVGCIIAVLSLSLLIENLSPKTKDKASKFSNKEGVSRILLLMGGIVAFAALLVPLGYIVSTFALIAYIMVIQKCKLSTTLATAFAITLLLFLIFQVGLRVNLPKGPLGF